MNRAWLMPSWLCESGDRILINTTVRTYRYYNEVVNWLTANVGNVLWSRPIVEWHGQGWHMKSNVCTDDPGKHQTGHRCYDVQFEDSKKATLFGLWT
jgi:hypothetical protein